MGYTTNSPIHELSGHSDSPDGLAFSPDSSLLASTAEDGKMRLWNTAAGQHIAGAVVYYVP